LAPASKGTPWLIRTHYSDYRLLNLVNGLLTLDTVKLISSRDEADGQTYYVPVKVPSIQSFGQLEELHSGALDVYRDDPEAILIFDMSIEAITFNDYTGTQLERFHADLKRFGFSPDRVWLLNTNPRSSTIYPKWCKERGISNPIRIIGYDFHLFELCWELRDIANLLGSDYDRYLKDMRIALEENSLRPKHFLCLNVRPRWHRWAIILHVAQRGWLSNGDVTFFGDSFGAEDVPGVEDDGQMHALISRLPSANRLLPHVAEIRSKSPITLAVGPDEIRRMVYTRDWGDPSFVFAEGMGRDGPNPSRCYFEIVNETYFTRAQCMYITEKTVRPLVSARPFLIVGNPGALRHLRELGFRTFSPLINESYDDIEDPVARMESLFHEIDRLCSMSIQELHGLIRALWPVLEHNAKFFKTGLHGKFIDHWTKQTRSTPMKTLADWRPWTT
jgi:hypothetical protein